MFFPLFRLLIAAARRRMPPEHPGLLEMRRRARQLGDRIRRVEAWESSHASKDHRIAWPKEVS